MKTFSQFINEKFNGYDYVPYDEIPKFINIKSILTKEQIEKLSAIFKTYYFLSFNNIDFGDYGSYAQFKIKFSSGKAYVDTYSRSAILCILEDGTYAIVEVFGGKYKVMFSENNKYRLGSSAEEVLHKSKRILGIF